MYRTCSIFPAITFILFVCGPGAFAEISAKSSDGDSLPAKKKIKSISMIPYEMEYNADSGKYIKRGYSTHFAAENNYEEFDTCGRITLFRFRKKDGSMDQQETSEYYPDGRLFRRTKSYSSGISAVYECTPLTNGKVIEYILMVDGKRVTNTSWYNRKGLLIRDSSEGAERHYYYDEKGNEVRMTENEPENFSFAYHNTYDTLNRLLISKYYSQGVLESICYYSYRDSSGFGITEYVKKDPSGKYQASSYSVFDLYDNAVLHISNDFSIPLNMKIIYTYDEYGNWTQQLEIHKNGDAVLFERQIEYYQ